MNEILVVHVLKPLENVPCNVEGLIKTENPTRAFGDLGVEIALITILHDHENPALI